MEPVQYSMPPDDGLQICPKHVEVERRNKLRINSASSRFSLHSSIECYDNPTHRLFADNRLQTEGSTDGQTWSPHKIF